MGQSTEIKQTESPTRELVTQNLGKNIKLDTIYQLLLFAEMKAKEGYCIQDMRARRNDNNEMILTIEYVIVPGLVEDSDQDVIEYPDEHPQS